MDKTDLELSTSAGTASKPDNAVQRALALVEKDIADYNRVLWNALAPQRPYLTDAEIEIYQSGKKIRPLMLLLSARMVFKGSKEESLPEKVIHAAVSTEMLHVATLIHDDIIDHAPLRRGIPSINKVRGTEVAILIGDLQFVQAIRCFTRSINTEKDMNLVNLVLNTAFKICCGELDELQTDASWDVSKLRDNYFQTIERKTAILFGLACECGVALGGGRTRDARRIGFFGRRIGRAFQMMDDLFDITRSVADAGKLPGTDLARRRHSLPIVYAMEELGTEHIVSRIMQGQAFTDEELTVALQDVKRSNGFVKTYQEAREQILDSLRYLEPFANNEYKEALEAIGFYVVNREYN